MSVSRFWRAEFSFQVEYNVLFLRRNWVRSYEFFSHQNGLSTYAVNSFTSKSIPAGTKLVLFGRYVLNFHVGIVQLILCETKTWCAKIYCTAQRTNFQRLTSAKKVRSWPSTHIINVASFVKIASNSGQAEVIARSTRYQTLWTDKKFSKKLQYYKASLTVDGHGHP